MTKEFVMDKPLHKEYVQEYLKDHKKIEPAKCPFCNGDLIIIKDEIREGSFGIICVNEECRSEWVDLEDLEY